MIIQPWRRILVRSACAITQTTQSCNRSDCIIEKKKETCTQKRKTFISSFLSSDFRQSLRDIIREEITAAFEEERLILLSEIERLMFLSIPCQTDQTHDTCCKQDHRISKQSSWELIDVNIEGKNTDDSTLQQVSDPRPIPAQRPMVAKDSQWSFPSDTTIVQTHREKPVAKPVAKPRLARRISRDDERECLAQALQANIVPLVDRLQFNNSDFPERLISAGYITEDECRTIRDDLSRKDQARVLVSRTKGRDLGDIKAFLELLEKEVPDVVAVIKNNFEENRRNNVKCITCALCLCSSSIDIKDVIDILWSVRAIPDGFFNEIVACRNPLGSQRNLWKKLIEILNNKNNKQKKVEYEILFETILSRGNFDFIVRPLRTMLDKEGRLDCHCHSSIMTGSLEIGSFGTLSSHSPMSTSSGSKLSGPSLESEFTEDNADDQGHLKPNNYKSRGLEDRSRTGRLDYMPGSLDSMLETILEENGNNVKKDHQYVNQTVEFHHPIHETTNVKDFASNSVTRKSFV